MVVWVGDLHPRSRTSCRVRVAPEFTIRAVRCRSSLVIMAAMGERPTIRDVARAAGVSVTTASDALNGKGRVDPATRRRVQEAGRRLRYQANRHARGLRSGRSGALGLLLPVRADSQSDEALSLDFYMRLASAAAAATFSHKQALMLLPPMITLSGLRGFALDGGIVVDPAERDVRTGLFQRLGVPVVTIERDLGRPKERFYVASNTEANTERLLTHLAERGAQRIALVLPQADWGWASETLRAYETWTNEHEFPSLVVPVALTPGEDNAFAAVRRLLARRRPPDALFVVAARFIRGAMRAAEAAGRHVPDDLLVAAGVDSLPAREGTPPITALDLHPELQAMAAVDMLLAQVAGEPAGEPQYIEARLEIRASTTR
jgi:DNA-binding LacI/PurR family transcriptional regulator